MENKAPRKLQGWLVLFLIALVAGFALAGTNELTRDTIAQRGEEAKVAARKAVLAQADAFVPVELPADSGLDDCFQGTKDGQPVGYVALATVQGYASPVQVTVGMDLTGMITGVQVGGEKFAETAGLGARAKDADFTNQFAGVKLPAKLKENVDAISGATITSSAVVRGVNQAGDFMASAAGINLNKNLPANVVINGNTAVVTKQGYIAPIEITITVDDGGVITSLSVGGEQFAETEGLGAKAKEEAFTSQFIGKSGQVKLNTDIDAISGATITSTAVVDGVNEGLSALSGAPAGPQVQGNTATATVDGFGGPIDVTVTVDENGVITALTVGGEQFAETEGYGARAKEEAFTSQFIGKSSPVVLNTNVDAISGATITSTAVVKGVNEALAALSGAPTAQPTAQPTPVPEATAAPEGRTAKAVKDGYESPIEVVITVDEDGKILAMKVGENASFDETPGLGAKVKEDAFINQFIGKTGPFTVGENIDSVSGATFSSKGVVSAVNAALESLGLPAKQTMGSSVEVPAATEVPQADATSSATTEGEPVKAEGTPEPAVVLGPSSAKAARQGFESPIEAVVTLDADGKITSLQLGQNASFAETEGLGSKVKDDAYISQFIGQTGPFKVGENIDAVSGATFSSKGAVEAVNAALESLGVGASGESKADDAAKPAAATEAPKADTTSSATTEGEPVKAEGTPEPAVVLGPSSAKATRQGFESPIEAVVTLDADGKITSLQLGQNASFAETEGLGAKVKDEAFISQFIGQTGPFTVGENIDVISGATFSSKGAVEAVNAAIQSLSPTKTTTVTEKGFGGDIEITVTVDESGVITAISVGGPSFAETEGLGAKAKGADFLDQFIGKSGQIVLGTDGDAISGATITSTAVVNGVNEALKELSTTGKTATVTEKGFGGDIDVTVTVDENGVITALTVGGAKFSETEGLGAKAKDEAFTSQFIGKSGQIVLGTDVDAISGATITSTAVVKAVNEALSQLAK